MPAEPYLLRLVARLADGISRLPAEVRARHIAYLHGAQNPDGGFSGREGGSDLYYTGFALRSLAVLDALPLEVCERGSGFLRASLQREASVVDFFSLLYSCLLIRAIGGPDVLANSPADWPDRVASTLEGFRTADGGYTKSGIGASGSTYHTFLVALCYELLGRPVPRPEDIVRFLHSRRRDDGGFVEVGPMRRSGTNPTAAAVGLMQLIENDVPALTPEIRSGVIYFLTGVVSDEGGLKANTQIPIADLLSTFTATWTLAQLEALDRIDGRRALRFAQELERPEGGFHGAAWDAGHDVEYTFYGLGVLALFTP
jgi:geranylgeranyl transferase type-2 subunit beta